MPYYQYPTEIDAVRLRHEADRRRVALSRAGCATYSLGQKSGQTAIVCLCCGLGSVHPQDIGQHFCGFCHAYHTEWCEEETADA